MFVTIKFALYVKIRKSTINLRLKDKIFYIPIMV